MGTMLYDKGIFVNTCFDELVVKAPDVVSEVHSAYADAGAEDHRDEYVRRQPDLS